MSDFSQGAAWMQGRVMPTSAAALPVTDWGLTHSDITYDVVHVWDGRFFRLDDYLARFKTSVERCHLSIEQSPQDIRKILHQIVSRSNLRQAYVSMVASRGQPQVAGSRDPRDCSNHFYAWCVPFVWVFDETARQRGAHLFVPDDIRRINTTAIDPRAKNYQWGDFTRGLLKAKESGFDNTLLMDADGHITEGPGFNVFIIKNGCASTAKTGVLEGITRKVAMELCEHHKLPVTEKHITLDELYDADEVFTTTTGGGLIPVTRVNKHTFSNDKPGEISQMLQNTYWQWHCSVSMSEKIIYESAK